MHHFYICNWCTTGQRCQAQSNGPPKYTAVAWLKACRCELPCSTKSNMQVTENASSPICQVLIWARTQCASRTHVSGVGAAHACHASITVKPTHLHSFGQPVVFTSAPVIVVSAAATAPSWGPLTLSVIPAAVAAPLPPVMVLPIPVPAAATFMVSATAALIIPAAAALMLPATAAAVLPAAAALPVPVIPLTVMPVPAALPLALVPAVAARPVWNRWAVQALIPLFQQLCVGLTDLLPAQVLLASQVVLQAHGAAATMEWQQYATVATCYAWNTAAKTQRQLHGKC